VPAAAIATKVGITAPNPTVVDGDRVDAISDDEPTNLLERQDRDNHHPPSRPTSDPKMPAATETNARETAKSRGVTRPLNEYTPKRPFCVPWGAAQESPPTGYATPLHLPLWRLAGSAM
jgi:hypothetical protein